MMNQKRNNVRKCVFTKAHLYKHELIRLVIKDEQAFIDLDQNIKSRGFYLKKDLDWIKTNLNPLKLNKKLKITNGDELYEQLINL